MMRRTVFLGGVLCLTIACGGSGKNFDVDGGDNPFIEDAGSVDDAAAFNEGGNTGTGATDADVEPITVV